MIMDKSEEEKKDGGWNRARWIPCRGLENTGFHLAADQGLFKLFNCDVCFSKSNRCFFLKQKYNTYLLTSCFQDIYQHFLNWHTIWIPYNSWCNFKTIIIACSIHFEVVFEADEEHREGVTINSVASKKAFNEMGEMQVILITANIKMGFQQVC